MGSGRQDNASLEPPLAPGPDSELGFGREETRMTLDDARIQRFLATKEVAVLATVQPDGAPLAMAMWFLHDPAALTMISVEGLQKVRNLRRDPRVCVVAEGGGGGADIRGVTVNGRAEFLGDGAERRTLIEAFTPSTRASPRSGVGWPCRPIASCSRSCRSVSRAGALPERVTPVTNQELSHGSMYQGSIRVQALQSESSSSSPRRSVIFSLARVLSTRRL